MRVEEIMTAAVVTCGPDDTLNVAAQKMWERDCGTLPVVSDGKLAGMITDRDICMAAYTQGTPIAEIRVGSVMASPVVSCSSKDSVDQAEKLMRERQIRRLPVLDKHGRLVGILSLNDIARHQGYADEQSEHALVETLAAISRPRAFDLPLPSSERPM